MKLPLSIPLAMGLLLSSTLPLLADSADEAGKDQAWKEKVEQTLADAAKVLREAESAEDLDEALRALESLDSHLESTRNRNPSSDRQTPLPFSHPPSGKSSPPDRHVPDILAFLKQWQVYLVLKESGDKAGAWNVVRSLSAPDAGSFMPRSELLQLVEAAKRDATPDDAKLPEGSGFEDRVDAILAEVAEMDDLNPALKTLRALLAATNHGMVTTSTASKDALASLIYQLQFLDRNYQDLKVGLPASLSVQAPPMNNGSSRGDADAFGPHLARLKSVYLATALPRFLGLPPEAKPDPNEDLSAFVKKVARTREENADPRFLLRCQTALSILQRRDDRKTASETAGLRAYLTGHNQEAAGQREQAVAAYLEALESNNELLPAEVIGQRLQALQAPLPPPDEPAPDQSLPAPDSETPPVGGKGGPPTGLPLLLLALAAAGALWLLFRKRPSNPS